MLLRLTALLIFFVLLFGIGGHYIIFKLEQQAIRKEIKKKLKESVQEDQLHHIVITGADSGAVDWVRKDKEFRYRGDMYDVVYSMKKDDTVHYYCISDDEETRLFAGLDELVRKRADGSSKSGKVVKNLMKIFLSFASCSSAYAIMDFSGNSLADYTATRPSFYASGFLEKPYPPPRRLV